MKINWQYFVMGLVVGGAVGFVWGLFNAPYSGAETQRLIAEKLQESVAEGQQAMAAREQELREALERARTRGS
jgi:gas vesicle protein